MGAHGFDYQNSEAIFREISGLVEIYGGISYQRLESGGLQWPCPSNDAAGTPLLYALGEHTRKSRSAEMRLLSAPVHDNAEYPFLLARGRVLHQPGREMELVIADDRYTIQRESVVEIHESDARERGISEGDRVEVLSPTSSMSGIAHLSSPQQGLISTTSLFGELITELERSEAPDPMADVAGLPLIPARIEKLVLQDAAN